VGSLDLPKRIHKEDYSLKSLDNDWMEVLHPHLHGVTETDRGIYSTHRKGEKAALDEIDSRGIFQRAEFGKELKRMNRYELEGKLGITYSKMTY